MSDKETVLGLVRRLPPETTLEEIAKQVAFVAGIKAAEDEADRGELIDHERVREELETWISG